MARIYSTCTQAQKKGWDLTYIKIVDCNIYDIINLQELIILNDNQFEAHSSFNTSHANHL